MVNKKTTTKTFGVDELVGKPKEPAVEEKKEAVSDSVDSEVKEVKEEASIQEASSEKSQEELSNRPQKIHIGGERNGDSGSPSGQSYNGGGHYQNQQNNTPTEEVKGFLDTQPEGHGFLRPKFVHSNRDIYISQSQIRRFMLRAGDLVEGVARPPKDTERYYGLLKVEKVNGIIADESLKRPYFDDLTPIYPNKQVRLATDKSPLSTRIIDLIAPIGFG